MHYAIKIHLKIESDNQRILIIPYLSIWKYVLELLTQVSPSLCYCWEAKNCNITGRNELMWL